jgi:hypothetical protein
VKPPAPKQVIQPVVKKAKNLLDLVENQIDKSTRVDQATLDLKISNMLKGWPNLLAALTKPINGTKTLSQRGYMVLFAHYLTELGTLSDDSATVLLIALSGWNTINVPAQFSQDDFSNIKLATIGQNKVYEKVIQSVLRQYCDWCTDKKQTVSRFEFKFNNSKTSIHFNDTTTTPSLHSQILSFCLVNSAK